MSTIFNTNFQLEDTVLHSNIHNLKSVSDFTINDYVKSGKEKSVLFFCSTTQDDRSVYQKNAHLFLKEKFQKYKSSNIKIYLFNAEIINHCVTLNFSDTSVRFNVFTCFFINYDSSLIYRAVTKTGVGNPFKVDKIRSQGNIYQVTLIKSICGVSSFSKVFDEYSPFIHEVLSPTYSDHERIEFLEQKTQSLESKNNFLENRLREQSLQRNEFYVSCLDEGDILRVMANQSIRSKKKTKNKTK